MRDRFPIAALHYIPMKSSSQEAINRQRRDSADNEEMDSTGISKAKALHESTPKRRPSLLLESLFGSDSSSFGDLSAHSSGGLHEATKQNSGESSYVYETTEMDYYRGSKSDSMIDFRRATTEETPRTKRRRLMQRRNSQTPEMLLASSATVFLASGGFGDTIEHGVDVDAALDMSLISLVSTEASETTRLNGSSSSGCMYDPRSWSNGAEVAEVKSPHPRGK